MPGTITTRRIAAGDVRIALLSTFPPTQCGLATFTAALAEHLGGAPGAVGVVRVLDRSEAQAERDSGDGPRQQGEVPVVGHLVNGSERSLRQAARTLSGYDVVVLQHEYGIFGGPDGRDVLRLVEQLDVPVVMVTHTVLDDPSPSQRDILLRLLQLTSHVVTMTRTARDRLLSRYGAEPTRVSVVPHGAADHRAMGPGVRAALPPERPLTVLTWGLLGPGKGIEWAIDALAGLRDLSLRYEVLGRTHPKVLETVGDGYREGLVRRAAANGVSDMVRFDASYLDVPALARRIAAADVVLLPYDSREQVTSGVLIEAVAAGRPVVSTGFPHAVELLGDGTGLVVPREDPAAITAALRRLAVAPGLRETLTARAEAKAPELVWPAVAERYREVARAVSRRSPERLEAV